MKPTRIRRELSGLILIAVAAAIAAHAQAADGPVAASPDPSAGAQPLLKEVVVTGTHLTDPNISAISPVTSVSSQDLKVQGVTRVEDLLNSLPMVSADQGSAISNAATGTATVSLRDLGSNRTLVLINGRRLMPGDPTTPSAADINNIPAALVKRVDVLTGGASAVYGADAVAGVVNFVMDDHFQGLRVDANYGFNQHDQHDSYIASLVRDVNDKLPSSSVMDGYNKDVTVIFGKDFADGSGNATGYIGYRKIEPVLQAARDFSACTLTAGGADIECGGSSTAYPGRFKNPATGLSWVPDAQGNLSKYGAAYAYNYGPLNYFERPDERYTGGVFMHLRLNDRAEMYSEINFMDDQTVAEIAPSGAFFGGGPGPNGGLTINCTTNPLLSAAEQADLCSAADANGNAEVIIGRRNVEGGPRQYDLRHTSYREVFGLRGEIADGWTYDAYAQNGTTYFNYAAINDVSYEKIENALNVITGPGGSVVCANSAAKGCVPYDIWSSTGVTPAATSYISELGTETGSTTERVLSGVVNGDLGRYGVRLPTDTAGVQVSLGTEYRQEKLGFLPDAALQAGDLAGVGGTVLPVSGQFHVWEAYTEASLPILDDRPYAKSLSLDAGERYSSYSEGFNTNTYKLGLEWAATSDVRLRGSFNRAVRAPNIQELYGPSGVAIDGSVDPCAGPMIAGVSPTLAQCERSGVTAAEYGKIDPTVGVGYNGLTGGNANLKPEIADTKTFGVVFTPSFLPGLSATVDYFDIRITQQIGRLGADYVVTQCVYQGVDCNLVHRSGAGSLWEGQNGYVIDTNQNTGAVETSGVDVDTSYRFTAGAIGSFNVALLGTWLDKFDNSPLGGSAYDCAGVYGSTCGEPLPKWRHRLRTTWMSPGGSVAVAATWRHIGAVNEEASSAANDSTIQDLRIGTRDYFDLFASYRWKERYTLRAGVNNVMDKDPPIISSTLTTVEPWNGNTYPQTYDSLGRYIFVGITADVH